MARTSASRFGGSSERDSAGDPAAVDSAGDNAGGDGGSRPAAVDPDRTDLRLVPAGVAGWAAGWLAPLTGGRQIAIVSVLLAVTAAALATSCRRDSRPARDGELPRTWPWTVVGALLVSAAVLAISGLNSARASRGLVDELAVAQAVVTVDLRIASDATRVAVDGGPPMAEPLLLLRAVAVQVTGRGRQTAASAPLVVLASDPAWSSLTPSTIVRVTGRLGPNDRVSREVGVLRVTVPPVIVAPPSAPQRAAERLRAGLRTAVADLPPDVRGLLPGLVDGDDSLMPADLVDDAKTTGLAHLTAVSGTNVSIVLAVVLALARWCGLRALAVPAAGVVGLAAFVVLARPDPSVIRASVMGLVVVLGLASGARRRRLSGLCAAVVVLLLVDPWLARSYGFALSVLASAAIVTLVPGWTERWSRWLPAPVAAAFAVPIAAQLVCGPVIVLLSAQVSVVGVLANLLAAPAVAPATVLGVLVAVLEPISTRVAVLVAQVAALPVGWIGWVARWFADRSYATIDWPGGISGALALAAVTLIGLLLVPALARRPALLVAVVVVPGLVLWGVRAASPSWPPPGWLAVACDVGQGDGLVVAVAPGSAIVVDTGAEPGPIDACLRSLGVEDVPLLLLTHPHADHIGGLMGVLAGRTVHTIGIGTNGSIGASTAQLTAAVTESGATVQLLTAGWSADVRAVHLDVLWPPADAAALSRLDSAESPENNSSVVVRVEVAGLRMLLTGDIEPSAQRAIQRSGVDLRADVLKVPHHGSRYQEAGFLDAVGAVVALVSVGVDNDYGHPSALTIEILAAAGTQVFRTDTGGSLAVAGSTERLWVSPSDDRVGAPATPARSGFATVAERHGRAFRRARTVGGPCHAGARWRRRAPPLPTPRPMPARPRPVLARRASAGRAPVRSGHARC